MVLNEVVSDALKDHIILTGDSDAYHVYDEWAAVELKSILEDAHVMNSVYVHPTGNDQATEPDMWCSVTWESAGHLNTIGFCYMSEKRAKEFYDYELWVEKQYDNTKELPL